jgi:hypothetical protein
LRVDLSTNDLVTFELSQPLRQYFLGRSRKQLPQLTKAASAVLQVEQNQRLPFSAYDFSGDSHGAIRILQSGFSSDTGLRKGACWRDGDFSLIFPDRPPVSEFDGNGKQVRSRIILDSKPARGEEGP